jgi:hypothetical protein
MDGSFMILNRSNTSTILSSKSLLNVDSRFTPEENLCTIIKFLKIKPEIDIGLMTFKNCPNLETISKGEGYLTLQNNSLYELSKMVYNSIICTGTAKKYSIVYII